MINTDNYHDSLKAHLIERDISSTLKFEVILRKDRQDLTVEPGFERNMLTTEVRFKPTSPISFIW